MQVEWRDAEDPAERSREILGEAEVRKIITKRFTDSAWFAPNIKQLQKVLIFPLAPAFAAVSCLAHLAPSHDRGSLLRCTSDRLPVTSTSISSFTPV